MFKILILSGKSFFGGAQAAAMAEYINFNGYPNAIISCNIGNINTMLFNTVYDENTNFNKIQVGDDIKDFWRHDGVDYYGRLNNRIFPKLRLTLLNPRFFTNTTVDTFMQFNNENESEVIHTALKSINISSICIAPTLTTSYEIDNLPKVIVPLYKKYKIDDLDKVEVTIIYNSINNKYFETPRDNSINNLLYSIQNESNELYYITKFFYPYPVNIIRVPSFYNIDIPDYDYEKYELWGTEAYLDTLNIK